MTAGTHRLPALHNAMWPGLVGKGAGGEIQLTDGIARLMKHEAVYAHRFTGRRFDCGNKLGYLQATVELSLIHPTLGEDFRRYLIGVAARLAR